MAANEDKQTGIIHRTSKVQWINIPSGTYFVVNVWVECISDLGNTLSTVKHGITILAMLPLRRICCGQPNSLSGYINIIDSNSRAWHNGNGRWCVCDSGHVYRLKVMFLWWYGHIFYHGVRHMWNGQKQPELCSITFLSPLLLVLEIQYSHEMSKIIMHVILLKMLIQMIHYKGQT